MMTPTVRQTETDHPISEFKEIAEDAANRQPVAVAVSADCKRLTNHCVRSTTNSVLHSRSWLSNARS
jgi:hypothetical protein